MSSDHRSRWIIIGISGVTCGGKTTLATKLVKQLQPSILFNQDDYFYPDDSSKHVKCEDLNHNNYDILSSLDMDKMHNDIVNAISKDIPRNSDGNGTFSIGDKCFMIIEGFTVLNYKPLRDLCDLKYYYCLDYDECLKRRKMRIYDPPDTEGYFEKVVWPNHLVYKKEIEEDKSVIFVDGRRNDVYEMIINDINKIK